MASIQLGAYLIRIRKAYSNEYQSLHKFDGKSNLKNIIFKYLSDLSKEYTNDIAHKKLFIPHKIKDDGELITGIIRGGDYGWESQLVKTENGKIAHNRQPDEAEMLPFYFLMNLDTKSSRGILLIEKFGVFGVLSVFKEHLSNLIKSNFPEYRLDINPLIPRKMFKYFLEEGGIRKLSFTTFKIPQDIADVYNNKGFEEQEQNVEIVVKARKNKFLGRPKWIKEFLDGKRKISDMVELKNKFKQIKIEVAIQGNTRTINLYNEDQISPYYDISDKVEVKNGHPIWESIDSEAKELLKDIEEEMLEAE